MRSSILPTDFLDPLEIDELERAVTDRLIKSRKALASNRPGADLPERVIALEALLAWTRGPH